MSEKTQEAASYKIWQIFQKHILIKMNMHAGASVNKALLWSSQIQTEADLKETANKIVPKKPTKVGETNLPIRRSLVFFILLCTTDKMYLSVFLRPCSFLQLHSYRNVNEHWDKQVSECSKDIYITIQKHITDLF